MKLPDSYGEWGLNVRSLQGNTPSSLDVDRVANEIARQLRRVSGI